MKFHTSASGENRVVPCGQRQGRIDRRTDMRSLLVAFRKCSADAPKIGTLPSYELVRRSTDDALYCVRCA
jgi:hypothetical protein